MVLAESNLPRIEREDIHFYAHLVLFPPLAYSPNTQRVTF
jgi:hypothetical protein